jgi:hypothetical protein
MEFDRQLGKAVVGEQRIVCVIDSVAALPPEIHDVFLKMDKKNKELMAMDEETRFADLERLKLSEPEQKALVFIHSHYQSNLLSPLQ